MLLNDLKFFVPELVLIIGLMLVFVTDLLVSGKKRCLLAGLTMAVVAAAGYALATVNCGMGTLTNVSLFSSMIVVDKFAIYFKAIFLITAFFGAIFSYLSQEVEDYSGGEYFGILLSMVLAMFVLVSSSNLLMIFLGMEFLSATSYILTAFRRQNKASSEAALKYVIYGASASGIMLFGLSYLYGLTGSLDLNVIGSEITNLLSSDYSVATRAIASIAFIGVLAGFAYKIASVPFHMWCPDVYQGAPTPITAILSVGPKAAGFAILIRFLLTAFPADFFSWEGISAIMFYLAIYLLMNLGAFIIVIAVRDVTGSEEIGAFAGLIDRAPFLAIMLTIFLFSLVGLPPLGGFIGKFYLFAAIMKKATFWYYILALIGVVNSAISLYYYARIMRAMFFEKSSQAFSETTQSKALGFTALVLAIPVLLLGIYWTLLQDIVLKSTILLK